MKKLVDFKYLILLWIALAGALCFTFAHHGNLIVDSGREAYYPTQILAGKVLYKDIFNIYGPFAYQFNAFLFKIFGIHLNVLYAAGCVSSFLIVNLVYFIAKRFMSEFVAFSISLFTLFSGVFSLNLFNFVFPYSYGMLYGFVFILVSLLLLFKYSDKLDVRYLYASSFFAGIAVVNKYDFFLYILVLFYAMFALKKINLKEVTLVVFFMILAPLICFSILFAQGLTIADLVQNFGYLEKMLKTDTLKYFYRHKCVFPSVYLFWISLQSFIKTIIPVLLITGAFFVKNRFIYFSLICFALLLVYASVDGVSFMFLPLCIVLWSFFNFSFLKTNKNILMLVLASILVSTKEFWGLVIYTYGVYSAPLLFVTALSIITAKVKEKKLNINQSVLGAYMIVVAIVFFVMARPVAAFKTNVLSSNRGFIYSSQDLVKPSSMLLNFLKKHTNASDTVMIFPEGLMFNFLADRKSDNYYSSLIPLYVETFGEDNIIEHFKQTKPDYIIFSDYNTGDYYFRQICKDYAINFCSYVVENYKKVDVIENGLQYNVYKKRLAD